LAQGWLNQGINKKIRSIKMVDLISPRTIDITKLAMDGLMMRQKAIAANTANVITPGYHRKEVSFEGQLQEIVAKDDLKQQIREQNSIEYNPSSLDVITNAPQNSLTSQQANYLQTNVYDNYNPQITDDTQSGGDETGNNVDMEQEVMSMATVGMKYNTLAGLEEKQIKMISSSIKGDM
jgi:flagellar basal-body rod protein FlgB